jgi:hypothetical protein
VKDDGVAFIQQISVVRRDAIFAAGLIALGERLSVGPEAEIVGSEILCPVENNYLFTWM